MLNKATQILKKSLQAGNLHHAILLYGNSLIEQENVAKEIATLLLGKDANKHPDLFELRPEGKARLIKIGTKASKVGGQLPPNTMRRLLENIKKSPNISKRKVAIVYEADTMDTVVANAFLKTLEEPPSDTTIFMLTQRPNNLLQTIRSRCISLKVNAPVEELDHDEWQIWLDDFKDWQKSIMKQITSKAQANKSIINTYALLSKFDKILTELADDEDNFTNEDLDDEQIEAIKSSKRRSVRKKMFSDIEEACVNCALGGKGVPAVKMYRSVEILEQSAKLMDLNMKDTTALEFFMLSSLRIWSR